MPAFSSTIYSRNNNNHSDPSKMFGLMNCEHRGFVGFEFNDYPEDIFANMEKSSILSSKRIYDNNLTTNQEGMIRI